MKKIRIVLIVAAIILIGMSTHVSANSGDFNGAVAIGSSYAGLVTAPTNGAIIQGAAGIGTTNPLFNLHLYGSANSDVIQKIQSTGRGAFLQIDSSDNYDAVLGLVNGTINWGVGQTGNLGNIVLMSGGANSGAISGGGNAVAAFLTAGNVLSDIILRKVHAAFYRLMELSVRQVVR